MRDPKTIHIHELIKVGFEVGAADVMLKADCPPRMKLFGSVRDLPGEWPKLTGTDVRALLYQVMNERQRQHFEDHWEMDLGFMVGDVCRVRCNCYCQRGEAASVMRIVPTKIRNLEELGLPPSLSETTKHRQGLVLLTGPTGSGKTTSLAALIDIINEAKRAHIVTIEDPLEVTHRDKAAHLSQREIGIDTLDYGPAMRAVVRQAPDVILIGEMRDMTSFNIALQAAETGHLVFSTVHTSSAYETLDRIINMFPPHEKVHLCQRLSNTLRAVVSQKLIPRKDGDGRIVCAEILVCTPTVTKCIEDGHFGDLYHLMNEGGFWGMQTLNQALARYVKADIISEEMALNYAGIVSELKQMLRR